VPSYDRAQKLELDEATLKAIALPEEQFYTTALLSSDPVKVIADFYTGKLTGPVWQVAGRVPLIKEENGLQLTFAHTKDGATQALIVLVAGTEALQAIPTVKTLAPKVPQGQNVILLVAPISAPAAQQSPTAPATTNLPARVAAENISFDFGDGWQTQGQITYPAGHKGPFPTVILVQGSGAHDMDGTISEKVSGVPDGSKLYLPYAYYLPTRGFAVVRYNKRGVVGIGPQLSNDPKVLQSAVASRFTKDAAFVIKQTLKNPLVDPQHLFLFAHSEGSQVAANLAANGDANDLAGLILAGVIGYDMKTTLHYQLVDRTVKSMSELDTDHDGKLTIEQMLKVLEPMEATLKQINLDFFFDPDEASPLKYKFKTALDKNGDGLLDLENELRLNLEARFANFPNVDFPGFGPAAVNALNEMQKAGSVTEKLPGYMKPVLMLNGEADIQTTLDGVKLAYAALEKAGNPDHKLITYPGLGHSFYPAKGTSQPLGPVQENVLKDLGDWLTAHVTKN
jgi:pimeloyl-ACP methyl ester carboxylesterase